MIDAALENRIAYWLVRQGLTTGDDGAVLDGSAALLLEGGVPLRRVATGAELLHPLLDARGCRWLRGLGHRQGGLFAPGLVTSAENRSGSPVRSTG